MHFCKVHFCSRVLHRRNLHLPLLYTGNFAKFSFTTKTISRIIPLNSRIEFTEWFAMDCKFFVVDGDSRPTSWRTSVPGIWQSKVELNVPACARRRRSVVGYYTRNPHRTMRNSRRTKSIQNGGLSSETRPFFAFSRSEARVRPEAPANLRSLALNSPGVTWRARYAMSTTA